METEGFPCQPLDAIAIGGLFEMAAADAETGLDGGGEPVIRGGLRFMGGREPGGCKQIKGLIGENGEALPLFEEEVDPFPALEFFGSFKGISLLHRYPCLASGCLSGWAVYRAGLSFATACVSCKAVVSVGLFLEPAVWSLQK